MRLVFMGSGDFALPSLEALLDSRHEVAALFTQPDKPAGRGHKLRLPPTKQLALDRGIAVHQPHRVKSEESVAVVRNLSPECIVVVAYGQIIPRSILSIPQRGIVNLHGSLLPRYRGAAPIQWAIARGETETGVTTMLMDEGLDTGPILLQKPYPIASDDTGASLLRKLAPLGAELLLSTLLLLQNGSLVPIPQDDSKASLAPRIKKEDALIDWRWEARGIHDRVRAFDPWPVAYVEIEGGPLKVWKTRIEPAPLPVESSARPGEILSVDASAVWIACGGSTRIGLEEVQASGKSRMRAVEFVRGRRLSPGDVLEPGIAPGPAPAP
jgi:methionyl-tRNA formyltransferase